MATWPFGNIPVGHVPLYHFHVGHFPPDALAQSVDLYHLFPLIMQTQSLLASGLVEETDTQESILKKICYALEQECLLEKQQIEALVDLVNPEACPSAVLPLMANAVCWNTLLDWPDAKKHMVVKSVVLVWMVKGLQKSWDALLRLQGLNDYSAWELYKSIIYERYNYFTDPGYYTGLRAARVDFTLPGDPDARASITASQERIEVVEPVRPIHVLLRPFGDPIDSDLAASVDLPTDSVSLDASAAFEDAPVALVDTLTIALACVGYCEASCQSIEEYECLGGCETSCQEYSETVCGTYAESGCLTSCQLTCQLSCEFTCEVLCQTGCELSCETSCEVGCETMCEGSCQVIAEFVVF